MTTTNIPASGPQLGFIQRLLAERASQAPEGVDAFMEVLQTKRITKTGASDLINRLLSIPVDVVAAPAAPAGTPARDLSRRSNAYPGKCIRCGQQVAAGAGYLTGSRGNWGCEHLEGACPEATEAAKHAMSEILASIPDGRYAIPAWTEGNDVSFWLVGTNKGFYNPEKKGQRFLRQVTGHHGEEGMERMSTATAEKVVAGITAAGIEESGRLYGVEIGQCFLCGRTLTSEWRKEGVGPECVKKL